MSEPETASVATQIAKRLTDALAPTRLEITDDSDKHRGHAGHDPRGESHFTVEIVSPLFEGKSRVERQRAVNTALADLLKDRVHALAIRARSPGEG